MPKDYLGHLSPHDPLYRYLRHDILPQVAVPGHSVDFRVFRMKSAKKEVFLYEERHTGALLVGKFFAGNGRHDGAGATQRMHHEFHNLQLARRYGFGGPPHHIVRPLGTNAGLSGLLVEEYCGGTSLGTVINDAIQRGQSRRLFDKLTALAYFLATLHNRTAGGPGVDFNADCAYLDRMVRALRHQATIGDGEAGELHRLRDGWREQPRMWEDHQVLVHGDATPSNFLFGEGLHVMVIDLERMKRADRVFDVGRIAGELQHFYLQATGDRSAAEPFIGHFLWEYACHFPDRERAFRSITGRVPFQMGLTLLRIARNAWVPPAQRRRLVEEAKSILRAF